MHNQKRHNSHGHSSERAVKYKHRNLLKKDKRLTKMAIITLTCW